MAGGITHLVCTLYVKYYYSASEQHNFTCMVEMHHQCARKVVCNRLGLVDFAVGLVNSVICLPNAK